MGHVRDLISTSWPGINADHEIIFKASEDIPPGGKLSVIFPGGAFAVMPGFDHTDVDLATATAANGLFSERDLAATSSASTDGIAIVASGTLDRILVTINTNYGIAAGKYVRIKLGVNAVHGEPGDRQIINANAIGVYKIYLESSTAADEFLDRGETYVVMIEPVKMSAAQLKIRSNGNPTGVLAHGTVQTIMSLNTNYQAYCSFAAASGTPYNLMTSVFTFSGNYFHSVLLTGLVNGQAYSYYVRCRDIFNVDDTTDYLIYFEVSLQPGEEGEESGTPGPGGGGSGGGAGGGLGHDRGRGTSNLLPYPPLPNLPGVAFSGWAYPLSEVVILKDAQEQGRINANVKAEFGAFLNELPQGVYTFGIWSTDSDGRRSITYSTTFWIDEGTQTVVTDIILPPTISLSQNALASGEAAAISGQSVPGSSVEVWIYPRAITVPKEGDAVRKTAAVDENGRWSASINTNELTKGVYIIKAMTKLTTGSVSGFSHALELAVETEAAVGLCSGADLNQDGRVNITDFSILLYWWGTDNECADQNHDGTVNLTDFSIMMFYWTG
ncbi:MAG: dockerin type I repeat-containing protein [Planctomycetes bacterium]|nr:dockerin type I repeat-containing protein [Planctomycetota bacterium]